MKRRRETVLLSESRQHSFSRSRWSFRTNELWSIAAIDSSEIIITDFDDNYNTELASVGFERHLSADTELLELFATEMPWHVHYFAAKYCEQCVCMSVRLFVCLSVCQLAYLKNDMSKFHRIVYTCYLWPYRLDDSRFCGWRHVFTLIERTGRIWDERCFVEFTRLSHRLHLVNLV